MTRGHAYTIVADGHKFSAVRRLIRGDFSTGRKICIYELAYCLHDKSAYCSIHRCCLWMVILSFFLVVDATKLLGNTHTTSRWCTVYQWACVRARALVCVCVCPSVNLKVDRCTTSIISVLVSLLCLDSDVARTTDKLIDCVADGYKRQTDRQTGNRQTDVCVDTELVTSRNYETGRQTK